jgi:hypothetical protein
MTRDLGLLNYKFVSAGFLAAFFPRGGHGRTATQQENIVRRSILQEEKGLMV